VLAGALVIVASMTLQVPLLALSLVVVFYVTQSNVVLSRLIGILFMLGTTIATLVVVLLFKFSYDYPLPRIIVAFILLFSCMYLMRTTKIGVMFYVIALIVTYAQTFADLTAPSETVVRMVLWSWVAANYAIALGLLVNTLFLPAEPVSQLNAEMRRQLDEVMAVLDYAAGKPISLPEIPIDDIERGMLTLRKLLRFAVMRDAGYRQDQAAHLACIASVSRLHGLARDLSLEAGEAGDRETLRRVHGACSKLAVSIATGHPFVLAEREVEHFSVALAAPAHEMHRTLEALADRSRSPALPTMPADRAGLFNPDAFTNPVYIQFALKVVLAAMLGYVFYLAVDWQGIHTVMLTCLVLAQPSLGASTRRGELRLVGALLGSGPALFMVVFIVPYLDGIVGLLMTCLPVLALGAWIQAGPERISYAGTQIMFTFSLALLEQFGPTTNLTEIRDRLVGIVLGIGLSMLIYTTLWPEAEGQLLRQRCAALLRHLADLIGLRSANPQGADLDAIRAYESIWLDLADCEDMLARVALEPGWQQNEGEHERLTVQLQMVLGRTREIMLASDAWRNEWHTQEPGLPATLRNTEPILREEVAAALRQFADDLAQHPSSVRAIAFNTSPASLMMAVTGRAGEPDAAEAAAYFRLLGHIRTLLDRVAGLTTPPWPDIDSSHPEGGQRT
jgi:multidrug resistance protein MdtO